MSVPASFVFISTKDSLPFVDESKIRNRRCFISIDLHEKPSFNDKRKFDVLPPIAQGITFFVVSIS